MRYILAVLLMVGMMAGAATAVTYEPTWESLDSRPNPAWFDEAKFGIFIHWGVYAVPAWGSKGKYSEWYWNDMMDPNGETWKFHLKTYGEDFKYQDFAPMFKAEMFDPAQWADIFARSGAKYVVLTSKHHEGFCLWPSPDSWNWNSVDIGPHRDLCGDLTQAVRDRGLKMGFYYSLYEWFNPIYKTDVHRYVDQHMLPQLKDLVNRYQPSLIFSDGEWDHPSDVWRSTEFLAWLYNESPSREDVIVDDRWGKDTRGHHGGYYTTEYGNIYQAPEDAFQKRKWEECRGMGASFGYNRNETIDEYKPAGELIHLLIELVARGGNLLLDIGPTADGRIPVIMQQRLLEIGDWLKENGEGIYGSSPWRVNAEGDSVRYTTRDGAVYAHLLKWPGAELALESPKAGGTVEASLLGWPEPLACKVENGKIHISMPVIPPDNNTIRHAFVIRLKGVE
ncbi:MAG: alpha-L-fucosidase [Candidatus Omnitrophica bacterium]|nr:MAG: Alpha-L-fucosidase [Candidatus Hinthialibacteria bacterium OLB16]MCL4736153.1 alpha-L-fucosidase [Candidatus Omnitrophota bacterium]